MSIGPSQDHDTPSASAADRREEYVAPALRRFGTFAAITQTVGTVSTLADKTGGGKNKTH